MTQEEKRIYLIRELLSEQPQYAHIDIPKGEEDRKRLLRSLMNVRMPKPAGKNFLKIQDEYLQEELSKKGITDISELKPISDGLYVWQGDITTLRCDAIVNAANSGMTGCYQPLHNCIDNCIHTFSGVQLRLDCHEIIKKQGFEEPTGGAKITSAYNLPCRYILHTVGPIVGGRLTERDVWLLSSCYRSCMELAEKYGIKSIAFCCISTGVFRFPNEKAAETAIRTVKECRKHMDGIEVIFNVFKDRDYEIYKRLLSEDRGA